MAENEKLEQAKQPAPKKADKVEKKSKTGFFARAAKWLKEMKVELKKVLWPSRKQTVNNTAIVLACVAVVGLFIWAFDFVAGNAIELLISLLG